MPDELLGEIFGGVARRHSHGRAMLEGADPQSGGAVEGTRDGALGAGARSENLPSAFHVIYLTGAPASGKSTLSRALGERIRPVQVFEYGQRLTEYLTGRSGGLTQTELRTQSSKVATAEDIVAVDHLLLDFVARERSRSHVVIDSHAVTKEAYGFRITPFSLTQMALLQPTMVLMLYTAPEVARARISATPDGRPQISAWEAAFHTELQGAVAVSYATHLGVPVYLLDSEAPTSQLVEEVEHRISRAPAVRPAPRDNQATVPVR